MALCFHGVFRGLEVFACPRYTTKNGYFSTQEAPAARVVLTATTAVAQLLLRDTHYLPSHHFTGITAYWLTGVLYLLTSKSKASRTNSDLSHRRPDRWRSAS